MEKSPEERDHPHPVKLVTDAKEVEENGGGLSSSSTKQHGISIENKPIKKKIAEKSSDDEDSIKSPPPSHSSLHSPIHSSDPIRHLEEEARKELLTWLEHRGIDKAKAEKYKVHIAYNRQKRLSKLGGQSVKPELCTTTTYISPEGSMLKSKVDVINHAMQSRHKADYNIVELRLQSHRDAKADLSTKEFPLQLGNLTILNLGVIDTRLGFHSPVQILPVGYKCEQHAMGTSSHHGIKMQKIICEILETGGYPQFCITVVATGNTFLASSEANVWRKVSFCIIYLFIFCRLIEPVDSCVCFEQYNPSNVDIEWNPSFFNLAAELLIEGLDNALECSEYKFHCERGYGRSYFTEVILKVVI